VKKTTPATYPSAKLRSHRRFEFRPENQTAAMSGVRAIQQSQLWSKGGKQAVQRSPLEIAASQGQNRNALYNQLTRLIRSGATERLPANNPRDD
jgi:hypothetical protein